MESVVAMEENSGQTHIILSIPYDYVANRLPRLPDTLFLMVYGTFYIFSLVDISIHRKCIKWKWLMKSKVPENIPHFEWKISKRRNKISPRKVHTKIYKRVLVIICNVSKEKYSPVYFTLAAAQK